MTAAEVGWVDPGELSDRRLVGLATARALVRTIDGRLGRLQAWGCRSGRHKARVEFRPGSSATIPKSAVEAVQLEPRTDKLSGN